VLNWGWNCLGANRILQYSNGVVSWYVVQNGRSGCWDYLMGMSDVMEVYLLLVTNYFVRLLLGYDAVYCGVCIPAYRSVFRAKLEVI
jgi:hypothetical protein